MFKCLRSSTNTNIRPVTEKGRIQSESSAGTTQKSSGAEKGPGLSSRWTSEDASVHGLTRNTNTWLGQGDVQICLPLLPVNSFWQAHTWRFRGETGFKSALVPECVSAFHSIGKEAEAVLMNTKLEPLVAGADRTKVALIGAGLGCRVLHYAQLSYPQIWAWLPECVCVCASICEYLRMERNKYIIILTNPNTCKLEAKIKPTGEKSIWWRLVWLFTLLRCVIRTLIRSYESNNLKIMFVVGPSSELEY